MRHPHKVDFRRHNTLSKIFIFLSTIFLLCQFSHSCICKFIIYKRVWHSTSQHERKKKSKEKKKRKVSRRRGKLMKLEGGMSEKNSGPGWCRFHQLSVSPSDNYWAIFSYASVGRMESAVLSRDSDSLAELKDGARRVTWLTGWSVHKTVPQWSTLSSTGWSFSILFFCCVHFSKDLR